MLYPGVDALNPPSICSGATVMLYLGNNDETDPPDPTSAKKGDNISEISSLPFPLVAIIVWGPT